LAAFASAESLAAPACSAIRDAIGLRHFDVGQLAILVARREQRGEGLAFGRRHVADDHDVLMRHALYLHPGGGSSAEIRRVRAFGDDAFRSGGDRLSKHLRAIGLEKLRIAQPTRIGDELAQRALALPQGQWRQVLAVAFDQVERDEFHPFATTALERFDQAWKIGDAVFAKHHGLAVDQRALAGQRARGRDKPGKALAPIEAAARIDGRFAVRDGDLQPIAIVFHLIEPAVAGGGLGRGLAQLGLAKARRRELGFPFRRGFGDGARLDFVAPATAGDRGREPRRQRIVVLGELVALFDQ